MRGTTGNASVAGIPVLCFKGATLSVRGTTVLNILAGDSVDASKEPRSVCVVQQSSAYPKSPAASLQRSHAQCAWYNVQVSHLNQKTFQASKEPRSVCVVQPEHAQLRPNIS